MTIATDSGGFKQLLEWAATFGQIIAFGIEGTGSDGAGLTSFVRRSGHRVVEVNRPDRRMRRLVGKSDTLDAENAVRAVLAGFATAEPKTADGTVEMIRQLKVAHDTGVKDRSAAMITLKAMLIHAPEQLRNDMAKKAQIMLARHPAAHSGPRDPGRRSIDQGPLQQPPGPPLDRARHTCGLRDALLNPRGRRDPTHRLTRVHSPGSRHPRQLESFQRPATLADYLFR